MRIDLLTVACALTLYGGDGNPVVRSWLINPAAQSATNPALRVILPDVQNVRVDDEHVYVESAGLSLQSLGALEANDRVPPSGLRKFVFRFPLKARPSGAHLARVPHDVVGAFLNGVPIYNPISPVSYRDQNLWHFDAVAAHSGEARAKSPLLVSLFDSASRHSPLIGFALDGFPIYGPYGWDAEGRVKRFRSSYRLRQIPRRTSLPDGTELTPSQEGPPVSAEYPLGTFVEDYEYVPGAGDLDEHNGRLTKTPEYPEGTYAYFLATYPYLVGPSYFGDIEQAPAPDQLHYGPLDPSHVRQIDLTTFAAPEAGLPTPLTFAIRDAHGRNIRYLETAHERPIHLLVVSTDLAEFAHIHPELQPDDSYSVTYAFPHGGTYWLYADYTRPGAAQSISRFRLHVKGTPRPQEPLQPDTELIKLQDGLQVKLTLPAQLRVGRDIPLRFDVSATDLQPYLGAWAHIMIVSEDRQEFIHAHPLEGGGLDSTGQHTHAARGPSPASISTIAGFRKPGIYRIWVQFQRQGEVITVPYTIKVDAEEKSHRVATVIPPDAVLIRVSSSGFEPARIAVAPGKRVVLAFERKDAQNCASSVVFPELGIRNPLPSGEVTLVEVPASEPRELTFVCGMGMYRGSLVIR